MRIRKFWVVLIVALLLAGFLAIVAFTVYKDRQTEQQLKALQQETLRKREAVSESVFHVLSDAADFTDSGEIVLSADTFLQNYKIGKHGAAGGSLSYTFPESLSDTRAYQLRFRMRASQSAAKVYVEFGETRDCALTTEWREYAFFCTEQELKRFTWWTEDASQPLELAAVRVTAWDAGYDPAVLESGSRLVSALPETELPQTARLGIGRAWDIALDGDLLYAVGTDALTISRCTEQGVQVLSRLSGLGNVCHLALRDSRLLAVASRENGVALIDTADPAAPRMIARYDALGTVNDICFADHYMFVADRYFGLEIVDIADPASPVYINRIFNAKDCFRCTVKDQYLFISCSEEQEIEIYDLSDLGDPQLITILQVDGQCGEALAQDSFLYVVSGYGNEREGDMRGEAGFGTGNGIAIYDISKISSPVWCASVKAEGELRCSSYADWSLQAAGGYLCFTNSFGGAYIYDIRNPRAPLAVTRLAAKLPEGSGEYQKPTGNVILPYNPSEYLISPVTGVQFDDGKIYLACEYDDVYCWPFEGAARAYSAVSTASLSAGEPERQLQRGLSYHAQTLDLYALVACGEGLYLAGGSDGLLLLDDAFSVIDRYPTAHPVKDVRVTPEGSILMAETIGMGTYALQGRKLVRLGFLERWVKNRNVSSVAVTGDGKFAFLQSSVTVFEAVDLHDLANPELVTTVIDEAGNSVPFETLPSVGNMYYANLITGNPPGVVGVEGSERQLWFRSQDSGLALISSCGKRLYGEANGGTLLDGQVIHTYRGGYTLYDPAAVTDSVLEELPVYTMRQVNLRGKVSVGGPSVLVAVSEPAGILSVVDIADPSQPLILSAYAVRESPGEALVEEDRILIPLRHGGIAEITLENK